MTHKKLVGGCAVGVTVFALAYLAPSTVGRGSEMDEGAVVAYPSRVLDGLVPHRDFLTFYGPGNLWLVAGAFATFGESVGTERAVGMLYRLIIVLAVFLLGLRLAGSMAGVIAGVIATVLMGEELVWAYATYGALAFGLLGLALLSWSTTASSERRREIGLAAAGLAGGAAVLVRFDFGPAVVLAALPLLTLVPARTRWWYAGGFSGAMTMYGFHLALVGPERIARVVGDLLATGPGRELPLPRPWVYPATLLTGAGLILMLFLVVGAVLWRRRRYVPVPQALVAISLFELAVLPWTLFRPDPSHIRPIAIVPLSLLPALALFAIGAVTLHQSLRRGISLAAVALTLAAVLVSGDFTLDRARAVRSVPSAYREFYDDDSVGARLAVERVRSLARPGESLFVGPQDLRRTNYGPTYMYFLLHELRPASYYMEMNPGTANREGSGLPEELRRADWLILTSEWDAWDEPNESTVFGPSEPNEVVRDLFCARFEAGQYRLYERCDRVSVAG